MAGLAPSTSDIQTTSGAIAARVHTSLRDVLAFTYLLEAQTDGALTSAGLSAADIAVLRSAYGDLSTLARLYSGEGTLAEAKDFRTFARRLFGFGL